MRGLIYMKSISRVTNRQTRSKAGFTLIELVVVMAIIAVLAALMVTAFVAARRASVDTQRRGTAKSIETALETFSGSHAGKYPIYAVGSNFDCPDGAFVNGVTADAAGCVAGLRTRGIVDYLVSEKALSGKPSGLDLGQIVMLGNATGTNYTLAACDSKTTAVNSTGIASIGTITTNATPICTGGSVVYITAR
jgi:prepilin-type N-terminal cleavage/methylation domain-containing protein